MLDSPRVLLIGGLDPCGGAGITADARTAGVLGCHPLTVATCLTVQNRAGFESLNPTAPRLLRELLRIALADGEVHAVKVGLCPDAESLGEVLGICVDTIPSVPIVVDPVMAATSGGLTAGDELLVAYRRALPRIHLLTPNLPELSRLAPEGVPELIALGCPNVLVTGGHADGEAIEDRLHQGTGTVSIRHSRIHRGPVHGTGCALAAAAAARLAHGVDVEVACRGAVADVAESLQRTPASADGRPVPLRITASRTPV